VSCIFNHCRRIVDSPDPKVASVDTARELESGFATKNNSGMKTFFSLPFFFQFLNGRHSKVHSERFLSWFDKH
jgi:hypothetical protein